MFEPKKFGNIGSHVKSGVSFQLWSYLGDVDDLDTISADGFFNSVKESLRRNDIIKVLDKTTDPVSVYELRVSVLPLSGDVETELIPWAGGEFLIVQNAIESLGFNLQASAYSVTTALPKDFIFDTLELNFSTTELKTITVLSAQGTILWGGSVDTTVLNYGYNTMAKNFVLDFNDAFDGGDNITVQVSQTAGACLLDVVLKVRT